MASSQVDVYVFITIIQGGAIYVVQPCDGGDGRV